MIDRWILADWNPVMVTLGIVDITLITFGDGETLYTYINLFDAYVIIRLLLIVYTFLSTHVETF